MNLNFRRANPEDDLERLSELIYNTDPYIYPYWFGSVENCKKELAPLLLEDKFFFNINNIYVAENDEGNILGLTVVLDKETDLDYDYTKLKEKNENYDFTIDNYISQLIKEVKEEDFAYISNVCVDPNYRDLHIGTYMVDKLIEIYKNKMYEEIALDVLAGNPRAIHLYEKMGFEKSSDIVEGFAGKDLEKPDVFTMKNKL